MGLEALRALPLNLVDGLHDVVADEEDAVQTGHSEHALDALRGIDKGDPAPVTGHRIERLDQATQTPRIHVLNVLDVEDEMVRAGMSTFAELDNPDQELRSLAADLESGRWRQRNSAIIDDTTQDLGYRLVVADFNHNNKNIDCPPNTLATDSTGLMP